MKVALVSEGTYPYAMGGVSVWCDQLIVGMPDYRWEVVALTVDGTRTAGVRRARRTWTRVHVDPAVGTAAGRPRPPAAAAPGRRSPSRTRTFLRRASSTPLRPAAGPGGARTASRFLRRAARRCIEYAADGGDLSAALTSNQALTMMMDAWHAAIHDGRR